jgi:hypothetical protein
MFMIPLAGTATGKTRNRRRPVVGYLFFLLCLIGGLFQASSRSEIVPKTVDSLQDLQRLVDDLRVQYGGWVGC